MALRENIAEDEKWYDILAQIASIRKIKKC